MSFNEWTIDFPAGLFDELRRHLLSGPSGREEAAYVLCGVSRGPRRSRLLAREIFPVPDSASSKSGTHVDVDPEFIAPVVKTARLSKSGVLLTHSHPFSTESVNFSGIDDAGERALVPRLQERVQDVPHGAIVFGQQGLRARVYPPAARKSEGAAVRVVGERMRMFGNSVARRPTEARFDRQLAVIPASAQSILAGLRVGIVGLGGTGSQALQQLLHVGVKEFVLVDFDRIEETNLNRLVGASPGDVGVEKVELAAEIARGFGATVEPVSGDVEHESVALRLLDCDVVFACTDNMRSRRVLDRLVHQYYIPVIDIGVEIARNGNEVTSGIVRSILLLPGQPCLECQGFLREDGMLVGNYGQGPLPAVSVVHWNAMGASLAVDLFLQAFAGSPSRRPRGTSLQYRILDGVLKPATIERVSDCTLCSEVHGRGDQFPLPVFRDAIRSVNE